MSARDTITAALFASVAVTDPTPEDTREAGGVADVVIAAIRGMSHDELRELRPDIAILFDATQDTATTRGDYIINLIVGRLRAIEHLHTADGVNNPWCEHDGYDWPCPTTRAVRGQA